MDLEQRPLLGETAVVTGGSRGIGAAVARRLGRAGAAVTVGYRSDRGAAEKVAAEVEDLGSSAGIRQVDTADPDSVHGLVDEAGAASGRIDVLVSCAGVEHFGLVDQVGPDDFDTTFAINTRGQWLAACRATRYMGPGGRIILTSSVSAHRSVFGHALLRGNLASGLWWVLVWFSHEAAAAPSDTTP